jgi:hypothetical protein
MSYYINHPEFFNGPVRLTQQEQQDPLSVVSQFFDDFSLSEIREINEQVTHACLATDMSPFENSSERDRLICYREYQERALEAAFLLLGNPALPVTKVAAENSNRKVVKLVIGDLDLTDVQKRIVDIQSNVAQLCHIIVEAYEATIEKVLHP